MIQAVNRIAAGSVWRQLLAALLIALLVLWLHPMGFRGGNFDDQRYFDAALTWWQHGPQLGATHWALRHPLILATLAAFAIDGPKIAATALVPPFFGLVIVAVSVPALRRIAGSRAAWIWVALFLASPIMHRMSTSLFPEIIELAFLAAALWLFWLARRGARFELIKLAASGAAVALAVLTRETAVVAVPLVLARLLFERRVIGSAAFLAGMAPVIGIEWWLLFSASGDPLYRLHIDSAHTLIASNHLRGGVFHGSPFFNPALAAQWIPAGPTRIHWLVNPVADLVVDPRFGGVFVAWTLAAWRWRSEARDGSAMVRRDLLWISLAAFVLVCWVLMLRPQPRYFLLPVYAATIAVALLADRAWAAAGRRKVEAMIGVAVLVLLGGGAILAQPDGERQARAALPYLARHPAVYHSDSDTAASLAAWMAEAGISARVVAAPPHVGDLSLRVDKRVPVPAGQAFQTVATISGKSANWRRARPLKHEQPILVERRLR